MIKLGCITSHKGRKKIEMAPLGRDSNLNFISIESHFHTLLIIMKLKTSHAEQFTIPVKKRGYSPTNFQKAT